MRHIKINEKVMFLFLSIAMFLGLQKKNVYEPIEQRSVYVFFVLLLVLDVMKCLSLAALFIDQVS